LVCPVELDSGAERANWEAGAKWQVAAKAGAEVKWEAGAKWQVAAKAGAEVKPEAGAKPKTEAKRWTGAK
jgi:hypothetical protein